jgi:hypothetical protein
MTASEKAKKIDFALRLIAGDIIDDREGISDDDANVVYDAIGNFIRSAPASSKVRLFDILTNN